MALIALPVLVGSVLAALLKGSVARLEGADGILRHVVFDTGERLARRALFFTTGQTQQSDLAVRLGCEFNDKGTVRTGKYESTHLPGLYVAGDASREGANRICLVVREQLYVGAQNHYLFAAREGPWSATVLNQRAGERPFRAGDVVTLELPPAALVLLED